MPVRIKITGGTVSDNSQAHELISEIEAQYLLAVHGCDTDAIIQKAADRKMEAVISPKRNQKELRKYNKDICENRYQVKKIF